MSFNNKINRLAQTPPPDNFKDLAIQAAGQKAVSEVKENIPENIAEYGAKQGVQKLAPNLLKSVKPMPGGLAGKLAGPRGMAAALALEGGISLAEEMQGPKKIFNNYYQDYVKLLNALASEFPQNQELQNLIASGKQLGQAALQVMNSSNVQGPTIGQALSTGVQSGKEQAQAYMDMGKMMMGQKPSLATYNHKMQRLAIVGEAEVGRTIGEAGKGALIGFAGGGNPISAVIGAATGAAMPIMQNIYHHTRSNEYQAAAYTNELKQKGMTLAAQMQKVNPQLAQDLSDYIYNLDNYVKQKIYKGGGTAFEKGIDKITKFFTREKDEAVDQNFVDQGNYIGQMTPEEQEQNKQLYMQNIGAGAPQNTTQNSPEQDQNIQVGVQQIMDIYNEGMQYYNAGNLQAYNQYKMQYNQAIQTITNYIAQKYPDQDPSAMLGQIMQQQQAQQQQMQQQGNMQQPQ